MSQSEPKPDDFNFDGDHCPACQAKLMRRKRESLKVYALRKFCDQKCYFDAVRARKQAAGRPFARGNIPKRKGYLAHT